MGLDVDAHIVVGLSMAELELENVWEILERYNESDSTPHSYSGTLERIEPYEDSSPTAVIVGFVIAESKSYFPVEIGFGVLAEKHIAASTAFYGLFKKVAKVYLVPRQW